MIHIDPDSSLFSCAVRNAIKCDTCMHELVCEELLPIIEKLSDEELLVIRVEIECEQNLSTTEKRLWEALLEDIDTEMQKRKEQREKGEKMIKIDPDSVLFTCAVRYTIGRRTYMPELVCGELLPIVDKLSDRNLYVMKKDIESELKSDIPEKELWKSLLENINTEMQKRVEQKTK